MRCLIADDHALIREGLKQLLSSVNDSAVIFEACDGKEVRAVVSKYDDLDFILLDYYLPDTDSLVLIRELCDNYPNIPVIVFSGAETPALMRKSLDCGASGFIPKSSDNDLVLHAIRLVLAGGVYTPSSMLEYLDDPLKRAMDGVDLQMDPASSRPGRRNRAALTARQLEVLKLISEGKTNKEIADKLILSSNTVKVHVTAILQVLHTTNRTEAVIVARELGLF